MLIFLNARDSILVVNWKCLLLTVLSVSIFGVLLRAIFYIYVSGLIVRYK